MGNSISLRESRWGSAASGLGIWKKGTGKGSCGWHAWSRACCRPPTGTVPNLREEPCNLGLEESFEGAGAF